MGGFEVSIPNCGETWWSAVRTWWSMVSIVCMSLNAVETFYLLYSAIICPTCTPCTPYTTCTTCTPYTPCTPYTLCTLHPQTEAPLAAAAPDYSSFGGEVQVGMEALLGERGSKQGASFIVFSFTPSLKGLRCFHQSIRFHLIGLRAGAAAGKYQSLLTHLKPKTVEK